MDISNKLNLFRELCNRMRNESIDGGDYSHKYFTIVANNEVLPNLKVNCYWGEEIGERKNGYFAVRVNGRFIGIGDCRIENSDHGKNSDSNEFRVNETALDNPGSIDNMLARLEAFLKTDEWAEYCEPNYCGEAERLEEEAKKMMARAKALKEKCSE